MPRLHQSEPMHTKVNRKQAEGLLPQNHLLHSLISTTKLQMITFTNFYYNLLNPVEVGTPLKS